MTGGQALETHEDVHPRVAFQGEAGAFSEEAVLAHFGGKATPLPCRDFGSLVATVASGAARFGMIPVENSLAGTVAPAYDALAGRTTTIVGEVVRPIRHYLMGVPGSDVVGLHRILSHPVALAQCERFLSRLDRVQALAVYDTAGAAMEVARDGDPTAAAVAPRGAAGRYGLEILAPDIQDRDDNQTRFYLIQAADPTSGQGADEESSNGPVSPDPGSRASFKTVILAELPHEPGSLHRALGAFARERLNLSKLESRPAPIPWTYRFILEVQASTDNPAMKTALGSLGEWAPELTVLGSFTAARRPSGVEAPPQAPAAPP